MDTDAAEERHRLLPIDSQPHWTPNSASSVLVHRFLLAIGFVCQGSTLVEMRGSDFLKNVPE